MEAGETFYLPDKSADGHLWIVISDPKKDPDRVLLVSMMSYDLDKEDVYLIDAGEHPKVKHKTLHLLQARAGDLPGEPGPAQGLRLPPDAGAGVCRAAPTDPAWGRVVETDRKRLTNRTGDPQAPPNHQHRRSTGHDSLSPWVKSMTRTLSRSGGFSKRESGIG
jgi:hypothetical protein